MSWSRSQLYTDDDDFVSPKAASLGRYRRHRRPSVERWPRIALPRSRRRRRRQTPSVAGPSLPEPTVEALPLPQDCGAADLEQTLKRLGTTASVLIIVADTDHEDGALMTWLSRGLRVRVTLLTLTRGEGGLNAMSAESYDALGLIRTN